MSGHHRQSDATPDDDSDPASDNASGVSAIMRRLDRLWVDRPHGQPIYDLNGREVAGYTLRDVIGQGTFGVVYLADDAEQQRQVALKLPRPEVILQADRMRRFRKEASIAASLDHPCIVPVYATDFDGPSPYIVSAYVDGPDLGEWLGRAARPVDFLPAARFVAKLADAVHHAHERGVTHRDLKPGNVLLQSEVSRPLSLDDYSPRLTDFGLAGTLVNDAHSTRASMVIGTPLYMAPEQAAAAGGADSPRADVYSLGVLLYELVTKQTPLEGLNYHQVLAHLASDEPTDVTSARADVPVGLQAILKKCLQHDAADRYASAAALAEDLARFVDGQKPLAPPPRATDSWVRWMRRPRRLQLAGTYSLFFHTGVILWLVLVMLIAWAYGVEPTGGFSQNLWDIVAVVTLCHFPKAMLGWLLIKGRNWTYLPSLLCSLVLFVVFVQSAVGESVAFEQNYPTRFSKLSNFSILITASLGEIVFYLVAWPAWRRATR